MIMRKWSGIIRTADETAYTTYIEETGMRHYAGTPGNLGAQMLMRALGDGTSEVTTLSWWTSLDVIAAFAGADYERARYYPEDDRFLLERPERVEHYRVVSGAVPQ
jgi:heme-degrading monooxygenase HmoA